MGANQSINWCESSAYDNTCIFCNTPDRPFNSFPYPAASSERPDPASTAKWIGIDQTFAPVVDFRSGASNSGMLMGRLITEYPDASVKTCDRINSKGPEAEIFPAGSEYVEDSLAGQYHESFAVTSAEHEGPISTRDSRPIFTLGVASAADYIAATQGSTSTLPQSANETQNQKILVDLDLNQDTQSQAQVRTPQRQANKLGKHCTPVAKCERLASKESLGSPRRSMKVVAPQKLNKPDRAKKFHENMVLKSKKSSTSDEVGAQGDAVRIAEQGQKTDGSTKLEEATQSSEAAIMSEADRQRKLGPQSRRGEAPWFQVDALSVYPHAQDIWRELEESEIALCDDWVVFYHSYSFPALLYEVNTAIFSAVFQHCCSCKNAPLPRLLVHEFKDVPNAKALKHLFVTKFANDQKDHHPDYRKVAISAMCSLVALGPEVSTPVVFIGGYSHADDPVDYRGILTDSLFNLIVSHHCPGKKKAAVKKLGASIAELTDKIIKLSEKHHLDVSGFGGKRCPSGKSGHLLQVFIRRDVVDQIAYSSEPLGLIDEEREPPSKWFAGDVNTNFGQVRIVAHPEIFAKGDGVQVNVASAEPLFHANRLVFQRELIELLQNDLLNSPALMQSAASSIFGGSPPTWWRAP